MRGVVIVVQREAENEAEIGLVIHCGAVKCWLVVPCCEGWCVVVCGGGVVRVKLRVVRLFDVHGQLTQRPRGDSTSSDAIHCIA